MNLQNSEAERIKGRLVQFINKIRAFRADFRSGAPFAFSEKPVEEAYKSLDDYYIWAFS